MILLSIFLSPLTLRRIGFVLRDTRIDTAGEKLSKNQKDSSASSGSFSRSRRVEYTIKRPNYFVQDEI